MEITKKKFSKTCNRIFSYGIIYSKADKRIFCTYKAWQTALFCYPEGEPPGAWDGSEPLHP